MHTATSPNYRWLPFALWTRHDWVDTEDRRNITYLPKWWRESRIEKDSRFSRWYTYPDGTRPRDHKFES